VPETDDAIEDLAAVAWAYRTFALENPMYYEIMFRKFGPSQQSIESALEGLANFVGRINRGVEAGLLELPDDLDPAGATAWLWATCHGLISLELDGIAAETIEWSDLFRAAIRTALSGLRPAHATTSAG